MKKKEATIAMNNCGSGRHTDNITKTYYDKGCQHKKDKMYSSSFDATNENAHSSVIKMQHISHDIKANTSAASADDHKNGFSSSRKPKNNIIKIEPHHLKHFNRHSHYPFNKFENHNIIQHTLTTNDNQQKKKHTEDCFSLASPNHLQSNHAKKHIIRSIAAIHNPFFKDKEQDANNSDYMINIVHSDDDDDDDYSISLEKEVGERRMFIICSIPIVCIAIISGLHIIIEHAPYFDGDCRKINCVAGSDDQFIMWSLLFVLFVFGIVYYIFNGSSCCVYFFFHKYIAR